MNDRRREDQVLSSATFEQSAKQVKLMTCLICNGPATAIDADEDYLERACTKCGHYRITGAALVLIKAHGWHFDVELARKWIADNQASGMIPIIDSHQAPRLIDV
ncbi:hypothetical protein [Pseudomonas umsongensis]|jgi:hypothetical protein|uniref:hypothetical protein n=1 Tax=Pseudomonas umsongensis TaxID=198618 RepID=UPI001D8FA525|nr:hypothetical protein [Pseudomonas umsongensis]NWL17761.1 hypothetical protein [Pseudomonas umsongensis]